MIVLSIDSSSKVATVAILDDNTLLGEYIINNKREHSVLIMDMISKLLKDCNLDISDIDGYVVSKGPGSFTGLRIGMATVKGLSRGSNKPYISISSLDALAYSITNFDGIICPIIEALRDNVYTALYRNNSSDNNYELEKISDYTPIEIYDLVEMLKEKNEKVIFTGDITREHKQYLKDNLNNIFFASNHISTIKASSLGEYGLNLLKKGMRDDSSSAPLYLKKPQAVRELEKRIKLNEL